jgi:hypothetical protein
MTEDKYTAIVYARLPQALRAKIDAICEERDSTISHTLRVACDAYVESLRRNGPPFFLHTVSAPADPCPPPRAEPLVDQIERWR